MDNNSLRYIVVSLEEFNRIWNETPADDREMDYASDMAEAGYKSFISRQYDAVILCSAWTAPMRSAIIEILVKSGSKASISFQETLA